MFDMAKHSERKAFDKPVTASESTQPASRARCSELSLVRAPCGEEDLCVFIFLS